MANIWQDPAFSVRWTQQDSLAGLLNTPRQIALAIVAGDIPHPHIVADLGSGPGDFLAAFLSEFRDTRGIWYDVSETMLGIARDRLEEFDGRVNFKLGDLTDVDALPDQLDVIVTSRALHHLSRSELQDFYRQAVARIRPGGWLANVDHVRLASPWDQRAQNARARMLGSDRAKSTHHHVHPLPSLADHLDGLRQAGFNDVGVAWQAFSTYLIMAQK